MLCVFVLYCLLEVGEVGGCRRSLRLGGSDGVCVCGRGGSQ